MDPVFRLELCSSSARSASIFNGGDDGSQAAFPRDFAWYLLAHSVHLPQTIGTQIAMFLFENSSYLPKQRISFSQQVSRQKSGAAFYKSSSWNSTCHSCRPSVPLVSTAADYTYSYGLSAVERLTADSFSTVTHVRRQRSFILAALGKAADRCDLILPPVVVLSPPLARDPVAFCCASRPKI